MAQGVSEGGGDEPAPFELGLCSAAQVKNAPTTSCTSASRLSSLAEQIREMAVGVEDGVDAPHALDAGVAAGDGGLPSLATRVDEAPDLEGRRPALAWLLGGAVGRQP